MPYADEFKNEGSSSIVSTVVLTLAKHPRRAVMQNVRARQSLVPPALYLTVDGHSAVLSAATAICYSSNLVLERRGERNYVSHLPTLSERYSRWKPEPVQPSPSQGWARRR